MGDDPARVLLLFCGLLCAVIGGASVLRDGWRANDRQMLWVAAAAILIAASTMPPIGR